MLNINTLAPSFTLADQNGVTHSLEEFLHKGKRVILYFYPKDNSSGCSAQACGYSSLLKDFMAKDTIVIGISIDSVASHKKFEGNYDLKFTLLSDPTLDVIKTYDVWKEKKLYGKVSMGVVRTTYIIDENGVIIFANDKVKAKEDPLKMLEIL